jgi:Fructose-bisphosphate aldolase class-II
VEGEIGDIGTDSEINDTVGNEIRTLTTPEEARQFVASTGIDVLAPAFGNMHGMMRSMVQGKAKKRQNIERTGEIKRAAGIFLTLHGGSGTDDADFRKAIAAGINIIHIDTELRVGWRRSLEDSLTRQPNEVVPYKILPPVVDSVMPFVASRLKLFSAQRTINEMSDTCQAFIFGRADRSCRPSWRDMPIRPNHASIRRKGARPDLSLPRNTFLRSVVCFDCSALTKVVQPLHDDPIRKTN